MTRHITLLVKDDESRPKVIDVFRGETFTVRVGANGRFVGTSQTITISEFNDGVAEKTFNGIRTVTMNTDDLVVGKRYFWNLWAMSGATYQEVLMTGILVVNGSIQGDAGVELTVTFDTDSITFDTDSITFDRGT